MKRLSIKVFSTLAAIALATSAQASTGCDEINDGDWDYTATQEGAGRSGNFDLGDVLTFSFLNGSGGSAFIQRTAPTPQSSLLGNGDTAPEGSVDYPVQITASHSFFLVADGSGQTAFTVTCAAAVPAPTVTGLSPSSGSIDGGQTVVITGSNFQLVQSVTFGGEFAAFTVDSLTQVTATAPVGSLGTVDVAVQTLTGTSADNGSIDDFTYTPPPTPVPTLSEWALILFATVLVGVGGLVASRRLSDAPSV